MSKKWIMVSVIILITIMSSAASAYELTARDSDGGFVLQNPFAKQVDVVVIGTELEGMYLARRAKQEGLKVLILETKERLGGQLIQGEMLYLDGVYNDNGDSLVQGGMKDLFDRYDKGDIRKKAQFAEYFHRLIHRIPIDKGIVIKDIETQEGRITAFTYTRKNGDLVRVEPGYVVDNSDDAAFISRLGGVKPLPGLESLYGSKGPREFMSGTYMMKFKNVDWHQFYSHFWKLDKVERASLYGPETYVDSNIAYGFPPIVNKYELRNPQMLNLRGLNILNQGDGELIINALQVYDVDASKPETVERGMQAAREEVPHILEHLRKSIVGFEKAELNGEPAYLYVREYLHYPTEYVMEATDVMSGRMFWDNVSIGGYFMDIQGSRSNREGLAVGKPDQYGLPLRSYLLKGYDNVVTAGKLVGSSVVAYGSTRIQPNGALAAESIGVLMGRIGGRSLKSVTEEEMKSLHQYLASKYHIQVAPREAKNKIEWMNEEQRAELNAGKVTLLPGHVVARHLPVMRMTVDGKPAKFGGLKPLVIEGKPWAPLQETFHLLGAHHVRYDVERKRVRYLLSRQEGEEALVAEVPVHVLNNFALVDLKRAADLLGYELQWDEASWVAALMKKEPGSS
ncbi:FAD-dependent oxidoreductase [Paenibacillus sp. GD4]|uniref:FAD-dependent oxidoreductase n=1 Tax=Paenibacillus sp. GD4 TaxID=3068890 RepID=UPI002796D6F3|nr:FAD-dependent oxidoreductase [Paenibacillus sp. GD4]MDQ1911307.1 FAD-dependent oxidoreductase [Paenibacillus sp. GD4]